MKYFSGQIMYYHFFIKLLFNILCLKSKKNMLFSLKKVKGQLQLFCGTS